MADGFTPVTSGSGAGGVIQGGVDDLGADGYFEPVRASVISLGFAPFPLGGSRAISIIGTVYQNASDYLDFLIPDIKYDGFVWTARVECMTADAGTSITPKIRRISGGGADAVVGTASVSLTWEKQALVWTPSIGQIYRLQFIKENDDASAWGIGHLERTVA